MLSINWGDSEIAAKDTKEVIANLLYEKLKARYKRLLSLFDIDAGSKANEIDKGEIPEKLDDMRPEEMTDEYTESTVMTSLVEEHIMMNAQEPPNPPISEILDLNVPEDWH